MLCYSRQALPVECGASADAIAANSRHRWSTAGGAARGCSRRTGVHKSAHRSPPRRAARLPRSAHGQQEAALLRSAPSGAQGRQAQALSAHGRRLARLLEQVQLARHFVRWYLASLIASRFLFLFVFLINVYSYRTVDMGLGKTLQSICILAGDHHAKSVKHEHGELTLPSLIVCPSTLTNHWHHEIGSLQTTSYLSSLLNESMS